MPWTVYCHTHVESGRRYIGITVKTMMHRWNQHCAQAKRSRGGRWHFPNAIRKYGKDAFSHEVLAMSWTLEGANATEEWLIDFYGTRNPEKGFNLAKGGQHVPHPIRRNPWNRPGFREKITTLSMNAVRTPEARSRCQEALNSPEVRARWSAASKAMWDRPGHREMMAVSSRSNPAIRASQLQQAEGARAVREMKTHVECPEHGSIPIANCYARRSTKGWVHYSCKVCTNRSSERARLRRLGRL